MTGELATVLEAVRDTAARLAKAKLVFGQGTHDADEEAVFLIAEALRLPVNNIAPYLRAAVTRLEHQHLNALVEKRIATRVPAAYLVNRAYLQGLSFYVDKRAIVPRSFLAELLNSELFLGAQPSIGPRRVRRVLDLCTGSGCLAILACHFFPQAQVDAIDLSADALEVATINVKEHRLEDRVRLLKGDLFKPAGNAVYDLIVCNPPYVDGEGMANLPPEFRKEPRLALAAGGDGLDVVRRILDEAGAHLDRAGGLLCEIGRCRPAIEAAYPDLDFLWLDTEDSSGEVFWLPASALQGRRG